MKKFVELMKKDFQGECFTKEEVVFFCCGDEIARQETKKETRILRSYCGDEIARQMTKR